MKISVIANPHAGTADVEALKLAVQRQGEVTIHRTEQAGDATRFARAALADGGDLVVAAGGDGTINEVVNGLAADFRRARLGIIPLGTGNDFARSINVPADLEAALDLLAAGAAQAVDVVRATSDRVRYFINVSAGGFSGLVDEKLTEDMKRTWGPLAYLRSAAAALPDLGAYHTSVVFDEDEPIDIQAFNIIIANAQFVAGGIPIAPTAVLDDGLLDVVIIPAASMAQLAILVPQILLGKYLDSELIGFRRARKLAVESQPGMWFNADGELVGNKPTRFEVLPQALQVIVGPQRTAHTDK